MSTSTIKQPKQKKVVTTVRFDPDLKQRAEEFARMNHMDFSTFLHFSLSNTIQNGGTIEGQTYKVSNKYSREISTTIAHIDQKKEPTYGPFEGKEALDFLKQFV